jgi:hypothetical protein
VGPHEHPVRQSDRARRPGARNARGRPRQAVGRPHAQPARGEVPRRPIGDDRRDRLARRRAAVRQHARLQHDAGASDPMLVHEGLRLLPGDRRRQERGHAELHPVPGHRCNAPRPAGRRSRTAIDEQRRGRRGAVPRRIRPDLHAGRQSDGRVVEGRSARPGACRRPRCEGPAARSHGPARGRPAQADDLEVLSDHGHPRRPRRGDGERQGRRSGRGGRGATQHGRHARPQGLGRRCAADVVDRSRRHGVDRTRSHGALRIGYGNGDHEPRLCQRPEPRQGGGRSRRARSVGSTGFT